MILFKDNVRIKKLTPALMHIFEKLYDLNLQTISNYPTDWVVTSINDSQHLPNSRHYKDEALDLRSKSFKPNGIKVEFAERLEFQLGQKFIVLIEDVGTDNEHFHIQVRKGETFGGV